MKFKIKRKSLPENSFNSIVCTICGHIHNKNNRKKPCKHIMKILKSIKSNPYITGIQGEPLRNLIKRALK